MATWPLRGSARPGSLGSVTLVGAFLPAAGAALTLCLVLAAVVAPWLSARSAREVEARGATARAAMTTSALEILEESGPLAVSGRLGRRLADLRDADRDLARATDDGARTAGIAAGGGAASCESANAGVSHVCCQSEIGLPVSA